jgi:hypothetical protein
MATADQDLINDAAHDIAARKDGESCRRTLPPSRSLYRSHQHLTRPRRSRTTFWGWLDDERPWREVDPMRAWEIVSDCKSVNLTPGVRESVLDCDFHVFVPRVVNVRMIDDDIFVRWKRKPNMDLESGAMTML